MHYVRLYLLSIFIVLMHFCLYAQDESETINYFQMEPLDDSLFIKIQSEVFIDPPDPKAEIIVDLRDQANLTVSIKGTVFPYLAFTPETRARIVTYPFKINLEEQVNYGSVFSRVVSRVKFNRLIEPPSLLQISSTLHYVNPFFQFFGGERLGIPIKRDIGLSFGIGTPYSGPLETNYVEGNFHILGFTAGFFSHVDALTEIKKENNYNNIYASAGYHVGYVVPFGNFFEFSYLDVFYEVSEDKLLDYITDSLAMKPLIISGSYLNWEFRYPLRILGSSRARIYAARYLNELHFGLSGREMTIAGSIFDFRFDAMTHSRIRQRQYLLEIMVQRVFDSWGFSALAIGPSAVLSKLDNGDFGFLSLFVNLRLKIGTSF